MAGRTVSHWVNLVIGDDSGGTLRDIPINELSVCGVTYEEHDLTAFQDAVKGALPGMPDAPIEFSGPWDTTAAQAASGTGGAPAYSGAHTMLSKLCGGLAPHTIDIQFGDRATWATNAIQFGVTGDTAKVGYIVTRYDVNLDDMTYSCRAVLHPESTLPAWGTSAET